MRCQSILLESNILKSFHTKLLCLKLRGLNLSCACSTGVPLKLVLPNWIWSQKLLQKHWFYFLKLQSCHLCLKLWGLNLSCACSTFKSKEGTQCCKINQEVLHRQGTLANCITYNSEICAASQSCNQTYMLSLSAKIICVCMKYYDHFMSFEAKSTTESSR